MYNYPRHGHHLVHAESHITQAVAAMDNCFGISLCCSHVCCVELTIKLGVLCTRLVSKGPMQHGFVRSSTRRLYMLKSPNKGDTVVHGCHCLDDMAVRMP